MAVSDLLDWDRSFNVPVHQNNRFGRSLMSLQDDMNRLMQEFLGEDRFASNWPPVTQGERFPSIDVIENEKGFKIRAELPGMDSENVDVSISEGYLSLKGERQEEKEEKMIIICAMNCLAALFSERSHCRTPPIAIRPMRLLKTVF